MLKNRIAQIVAGLALVFFAVNLWTLTSMWSTGDMAGALGEAALRQQFIQGFFNAMIDPLFMVTSAYMIEYLARGARYLEGIGIMLKDRIKDQDDE
jgi:succinate dehydrogenase hydrophobic anchor subunit